MLGRFLSADTIVPSPGNPQSLNRYAYVYNNPLRYTDSTGHCADDDKSCIKLRTSVETDFGVKVDDRNKLWTKEGLYAISKGMTALAGKLKGGMERFREIFAGTVFARANETKNVIRDRQGNLQSFVPAIMEGSTITYYNDPRAPSDMSLDRASEHTVHELSHVWDNRTGGALSKGIARATGSTQGHLLGFLGIDLGGVDRWSGNYNAQGQPATGLAMRNDWEDWAESLRVTVYGRADVNGMDPVRRAFVYDQLKSK